MERPSFSSFLSPAEQFAIDEAVPLKTQQMYEHANNRILRWKGGMKFQYEPTRESNQDHINGCLTLIHGYERIAPELTGAMNISEVKFMILLHDIDELVMGFDLPMLDPRREQKKGQQIKKVGIYLAAKRLIRNYIEPEYVEYATGLYFRFLEQNPDDKEALFARYIDKAQGNRFGCVKFFPYSHLGITEPEPNRRKHTQASLESILKPGLPLLSLLSGEAKSTFYKIIHGDIQRFADIGFEPDAERAMTRLNETAFATASV